MEEKMESEHSYSGESSSSSDSSSGSSEVEEETLEPVRILGHSLELPQELCEDYSVFKEFFSMKTWEALEDKHKEQLMEYLPKFTENDKEEKQKTIKMLFTHEPFHFTSPLSDFYNNLRQGNYRPDIAKMRKFLMKARAKQQRHKIKSYYAKLLPEVLISRERLLAAARAAPPGPIPCLPLLPPKPPKNNYKPVYLRARQRYFEELTAIRSEVGGEMSDDENYPEGPPEQARKRKQINPAFIADGNISGTLSGSEQTFPNSLERLKNVLASHRIRRQYRETHPELNTAGITLEDIKQRVTLVNGAKKLMFGGPKSGSAIQKIKRGSKKESSSKTPKGSDKVVKKGKEDAMDSGETKPLLPNIKIKSEPMESDSEGSSFVDPVVSPKHSKKPMEHVEVKQEVVDNKYLHSISNVNYNDTQLESVVKQEPQDSLMTLQNSSRVNQPVPIKLEDLDGIDMMALPVELADDSGEVIQVETSTDNIDESVIDVDESLTETTHANFLSLVRALFPARAAHRASKQQLHARCTAVMRSAIAPLNTWYNLSDDWCAELDSALDFLAGERGPHPDDFVPYLQFIPETQMYQWIGAGRDCDAILGRLCERWLRSASPPPPSSEPPPPRYPTSWVVRAPTSAEIADFWSQERRRFSSAAKPFTYVQYGYRSVVGPCARWWGAGGAGAAGGAAGASLLAATRPRHAVFAALVRDAVARLPNGEGTRHDVLTLLKMSQWITPTNDQALLSAVSSTLEKLQSAKRDPIVKYDQRTAVWTYLHRHRTEEDWAKTTGKGRNSKASANQAVATTAAAPILPPPTVPPLATYVSTTKDVSAKDIPAHCLEVEVGSVEEVVEASDSDVDVDDSSTPSAMPQLSSAQLLMQATQSQTKQQLPQKPKGKLVATTPKPKAQTKQSSKATKQTNLMTQSVKQANLIAQSVKQANLTSQTAKSSQVKASVVIQSPKQSEPSSPKAAQKVSQQTPKQSAVKPNTAHAKPASVKPVQITKPNVTQIVKHGTSQSISGKINVSQAVSGKTNSQSISSKTNVSQVISSKPSASSSHMVTGKQNQSVTVTNLAQVSAQLSKSLPSVVTSSQKSPLIKQRPLLKNENSQSTTSVAMSQQVSQPNTILNQPTTVTILQNQNKVIQGTRSLLIRPPAVQTTVTAVATTSTTQVTQASRRGVVRVLSPATPSSGKSLISPRALMQSNTQTTKKRTPVTNTSSVTTVAQSTSSTTAVVSSVPTVVSSSVTTRTVQLASGRTVQLSNQTVHLPGGQAVQLSSGHTLQLSSLQLPTHSVRLPSGQTVQLAAPQSVQTVRVPTSVKTSCPRPQTTPLVKNIQTTQSTVQIPVSTVQLAGQTVQIAGQTVQLAGQSVQLTGHTVKLPSGQSVQVAGQSVLPSQSVQLPSGQTVQLAGNLQTVQLGGSNLQLSGQSVQMPSGQSVQLGGQTVQLAGQTVQLGGQTVQLSTGQTIQLSSGQTLQLASGQTVQLASQTAKPITQVVRSQAPSDKTTTSQPIVAKLLTNAQGQMISLEGVMGGVRPRPVRLLSPAARLPRPLLLTAHKPLHNIILQQSDGTAIRVTSSGGITSTQSLVLSNLAAQTHTTSSTSPPVLKLQQAGTSPSATTSSGVRSVLMDGQQLKLVGGRHVLARILRPAHPPQ